VPKVEVRSECSQNGTRKNTEEKECVKQMGLNFKSGVKPWKAEESDRRLEWTQELWLGDMCKMKDVQDKVNQEESEHNEVDGMKKGADSTGKVMHVWKSGWWFVMRKMRMVELDTIRYDTIR